MRNGCETQVMIVGHDDELRLVQFESNQPRVLRAPIDGQPHPQTLGRAADRISWRAGKGNLYTSKLFLTQLVLLNGRAHRAIDDHDAFAEQGF